jgi:hypothetical protein
VFRNFYQCDECPNEWSDTLLCVSVSWCPSCDMEIAPYSSDEMEEEVVDDDEEVEA